MCTLSIDFDNVRNYGSRTAYQHPLAGLSTLSFSMLEGDIIRLANCT